MKKLFIVLVILNLVILFSTLIYTSVQKRTQTSTQYKFDLKAGQRIIVIDVNAASYIRITPPEGKIFDLKIDEGKTLSGILIENKIK